MKRISVSVFLFILLPMAASAQSVADASATGISRAFNPAISVNGLFYMMSSSLDEPLWEEQGLTEGIHLQEMSIEMTSNVDVYLKATAVLSASEEGGAEVEEAYVTTLRMPIPVNIRAGKMFNTFGRHNLYHLHHMAFAEPPMILVQVFGPDLNELSVEASYLVPLPWYMDFTLGVLDGQNHLMFDSDDGDDYAYLAHLDNMWDLGDETSLRLGGSYLAGQRGLHYYDGTPLPPNVEEAVSQTWGVDLHLKWRPLQYGDSKSVALQGEYVESTISFDEDDLTDPVRGYFIQLIGQFDKRMFVQARYDWFNRPAELHPFFAEPVALEYDPMDDLAGERVSFAVAFVPTEFSAYRVQYNMIEMGDHSEYQVLFQLNYTIGSHPAHQY